MSILLSFNYHNHISAFGFGAIVKNAPEPKKTSNCFSLNGNIFKPNIKGMEMFTEYYKNVVQNIEFCEGSRLSYVIDYISSHIS